MSCSLVIPVYRNEANLPALLDALETLRAQVPGGLEVVFVVDGSPDRCLPILRERLPQCRFASKLVAHARNFGSFAAIRTGLQVASGPHFAVMAADLQEPITLVAEFFRALRADEADVVVGQRVARSDPGSSSLAAKTFWWLYRRLINPDVPEGGVDVFGCNAVALKALLSLNERNSSLVAQLFWVGFRRKLVPYERQARTAGVSAWTFSKKVRYLLDSVYSFTDLPIRLLSVVGAIAMAAAVLLGFVVLASRLTDRIQLPGYTPTILTIVFFGGLNALGLGIIGEYVWRAFENTKARPLALVLAEYAFDGESNRQAATAPRA